jgi:AcrR family transcriptional regulator
MPSETRQQLLRAALKHFANSGYAATSVQDIVDDARLSKPALYYHFKDKAGLFQSLVHEAHDGSYRLLLAAVAGRKGIRAQLESAFGALFAYFKENRELMRISFATMFAAPGEVPEDAVCLKMCERNFELLHSLIKEAQKNGELDGHFGSEELVFGILGMVHCYSVGHLMSVECQPDQNTANRIVDLFLAGAGPKTPRKSLERKSKGKK